MVRRILEQIAYNRYALKSFFVCLKRSSYRYYCSDSNRRPTAGKLAFAHTIIRLTFHPGIVFSVAFALHSNFHRGGTHIRDFPRQVLVVLQTDTARESNPIHAGRDNVHGGILNVVVGNVPRQGVQIFQDLSKAQMTEWIPIPLHQEFVLSKVVTDFGHGFAGWSGAIHVNRSRRRQSLLFGF